MNLKNIWSAIKSWKFFVVVITFLTSIIVGIKLFWKGKITYDQFNKRIKKIEKDNKRLIDESNDYRNKRLRFFQRLKKREPKQ